MYHPHFTRAVLGAALLCAGQAQAHGYLSQPEARNLLCKSGTNSQCGAVQWEPQSLEGPSGYPARGPADGTIAAAGLAQFAPLNEQSASRWAKRAISAGPQTFSWTFTANHVSRNFRYYLTRPDWNPNQSLSRASFEEQPFCQHDGGMRQPPKVLSHSCQLPARRGYQLLLAVWEVGDTPMSFYNVADLMFQDGGGSTPTPISWAVKGTLYPSVDLSAGDSVSTRVFDERGERADLKTRLRIASTAEGQRDSWPYLLAGRINAEQTLLRAGQRGADGSIHPVPGRNEVFASQGSGLQRVELQIDKAPPPATADLLVGGLPASLALVNGQATLSFTVTAVGEMDISATLLDHGGQAKGVAHASLNNSGQQLRIVLNQARPGHHQLVLKGQVKGSGELLQKTLDLMLTAGGDTPGAQRFPDGLRGYQAGTKVLQPKTGAVYECRPWPHSGYCSQWSPSATHYEPGVGSHWREAWVQR